MSRARIIVLLAATYAVMGVMMNSVGVVILQSIRHFDATAPMGSTLEACKDLSVVAASFLLAARIPAMGYRRSVIVVMAVMATACLLSSFADRFLAMQALFVATGFCFGVAKVAIYSTIGLIARDPADHASVTGVIEGVFMVGLLAGIWLFGGFIAADGDGTRWLRVYWLLGGICALVAVAWVLTPLDERDAVSVGDADGTRWADMLRAAALPASAAVLVGLFLYVLVEQGIGTWLPTFNNQVLRLPPAMSVKMSSIFVGALAFGRLASGVVLRRVDWLTALLGCLGCIAALILLSLPLAGADHRVPTGWSDAPAAAYLFPVLGMFLAPIYPTLCSAALSALPSHRHAAMMGLIVIFSALGGTLGSFITGLLFQWLPGALAFYFTLVPIALIAVTLPVVRRRQRAEALA